MSIKTSVDAYLLAHAVNKNAESARDIDFWLNKIFPDGINLTWAVGKLKGRLCALQSKSWEVDPSGKFTLWFNVRTYRQKKGVIQLSFIDDNDYTHRRCWGTHAFEETKNFELWEPK